MTIQVLSQSGVLSTASRVIRSYPSIASAYLFGSYAKGTARPDSDIDIALFLPDFGWDKLGDVGGAQMDLENALHKKIDLSICPPDDFVEKIQLHWVPIKLDDVESETPITIELDEGKSESQLVSILDAPAAPLPSSTPCQVR